MTDRTELTGAAWHKSTRSGAEGNCVEVADNLADLVAVRDSKDPYGPILTFAAGPWRQFVRGVRRHPQR
ncbi:DUF397 domain-containing protein [Plantactinospora sp. DSM 117369]